VRVRVRNGTARDVLVRWLDFDGKRSTSNVPQHAHATGDTVELFTYVNHVFVVTDLEGTALATFVVPEGDGVLELR
jgi:hypothetical protein